MKKNLGKVAVEVYVDLDIDSNPYVVGRNGAIDIKGVKVWTGAGGSRTFVDLVSKARGQVVNAGFSLDAIDMDKLAVRWLLQRGYVIRKEPTALIPQTYEELQQEKLRG